MIDLLDQPARTVAIAVVDLEMTGLDIDHDRVIEVAIVRGDGSAVVAEFRSLLKVGTAIPRRATELTGITHDMLLDQPTFADVAEAVRAMVGDAVVVAHNVPYDVGFLHREFDRAGAPMEPPTAIDTLLMARRLFAFRKNDLATCCEQLGIALEHHRALSDARATFALYHRMLEILDPDSTVTVRELNDLVGALAPNSPLRLRQQKLIRQALDGHRTLYIDYQSTSSPVEGTTRREIGVWKVNLPYIQAWCYLREGERIFRLDRIQQVLPGGREYAIPPFKPRV